jgi:hypothetical protein
MCEPGYMAWTQFCWGGLSWVSSKRQEQEGMMNLQIKDGINTRAISVEWSNTEDIYLLECNTMQCAKHEPMYQTDLSPQLYEDEE